MFRRKLSKRGFQRAFPHLAKLERHDKPLSMLLCSVLEITRLPVTQTTASKLYYLLSLLHDAELCRWNGRNYTDCVYTRLDSLLIET